MARTGRTEDAAEQSAPASEPATPGRWSVRKLSVLLLIVAVSGGLWWRFGDDLSLQALAEREAAFREFQQTDPFLTYGVAFVIYVVATGLSLPGATVLSIAYGWFFRLPADEYPWYVQCLPGLILVSFASTSGATLAFLMSRYLFREAFTSKFGDRLARFNRELEREGAFYLFTLRLIPAFPFFVINAVMGLTPMRLATYWWVSQLGMLPGTILIVWAGSRFPDVDTLAKDGAGGVLTWDIAVAFVLLGVFPLAVRKLMKRGRGPRVEA
ncbi:TVP38/TMEM64 family protein [bacterium]|nr:TVP38/TMEM64 family protein [bacterium]